MDAWYSAVRHYWPIRLNKFWNDKILLNPNFVLKPKNLMDKFQLNLQTISLIKLIIIIWDGRSQLVNQLGLVHAISPSITYEIVWCLFGNFPKHSYYGGKRLNKCLNETEAR